MADVIQLGMSADDAELVDALAEERSQLQETESAFEKFGNAIADSMRFAGSVAIGTLQAIGSVAREVAVGALHEFGAMTAQAMASVAGSAVDTTHNLLGTWGAIRVGLGIAGRFVPVAGQIGFAMSVATLATSAYAEANERLNGELTRTIFHGEETAKAWSKLGKSAGEFGGAVRGVASDMAVLAGAGAMVAAEASGVGGMFELADTGLAAMLSGTAEHLSLTAQGFQALSDSVMDLGNTTGPSTESLRKMTEATEAAIAKQEASVGMFQQLKAMQASAAAQAKQTAEMMRISSLTTVEAVEAEIMALREKTAQVIASGNATAASQAMAAAQFAALEQQKLTIDNNEKQKALEAELAATEAINRAKEEQRKLDESAADQMARLKDEIDLATGAATKGDIAFRNMMREGYTAEQANEIARLTDELAELQKPAEKVATETKNIARPDRSVLKSAFAGSSEAASIMLRGVGGGKTMESLAQKQVTLQTQMVAGINRLKMPSLTPLTLGTV